MVPLAGNPDSRKHSKSSQFLMNGSFTMSLISSLKGPHELRALAAACEQITGVAAEGGDEDRGIVANGGGRHD